MVQVLRGLFLFGISLSILLPSFLKFHLYHTSIILTQHQLTLRQIIIRNYKSFFFSLFLKNFLDFIIFSIIFLIVFIHIFSILFVPFFFRIHLIVNDSLILNQWISWVKNFALFFKKTQVFDKRIFNDDAFLSLC